MLLILDAVSPNDKDKAVELMTEQLRRLSPESCESGFAKGGGDCLKKLTFSVPLGFLQFTGISSKSMTKAQRYLKGIQDNGQESFLFAFFSFI